MTQSGLLLLFSNYEVEGDPVGRGRSSDQRGGFALALGTKWRLGEKSHSGSVLKMGCQNLLIRWIWAV